MKRIDLLRKKSIYIRLKVLGKAYESGKAHIGGTFSCVDLLVALFYGNIIGFNKQNAKSSYRDKLLLSKGHACIALYAIYLDYGIISRKLFDSYGTDGGLGGQLDVSLPGVDFNTGSLGNAVGVGAGMALSFKLSRKNFHVFTILGDSELFEGAVWEAIIFAGEQKINNLVCVIDRNRFMVTEKIDDNVIYKNLQIKIKAFGWNYLEVNGHNFKQIISAFKKAQICKFPTMIVANTVKGKGVSFMENGLGWYSQTPTEEEFRKAKKELLSGY